MKFPLLLLPCLLVGIAAISPASSNEDHNAHHKANAMHTDSAGHHHGQIEVSGQEAVPEVSLTVTPDARMGWNLHVTTENFRFAPEDVNAEHAEGEGHAHLYVDGHKITRLYGPWFYLGDLTPGEHTVRVTLNGNDHSDLVLHGKPVAAEVSLPRE